VTKHYEEALALAEKVDADELEKAHKDWGQRFDREFRAGLRLVVQANETADASKSVSGHRLMNSWGAWLNANIDAIRRMEYPTNMP